jgi:hypothetical protein
MVIPNSRFQIPNPNAGLRVDVNLGALVVSSFRLHAFGVMQAFQVKVKCGGGVVGPSALVVPSSKIPRSNAVWLS